MDSKWLPLSEWSVLYSGVSCPALIGPFQRGVSSSFYHDWPLLPWEGGEEALLRSPFLIARALHSFIRSRVFPDKEVMLDTALALAAEISTKSPVAVQSTKVNLLYSRDHSVADGLNYMVRLFI